MHETANPFAPHMSPSELDVLVQAAWSQHYRQPALLVARGRDIAQHAGVGTWHAAWGWLHQAWGQRFAGDADASTLALCQAQHIFAGLADERGLAACRDLQAMVLGGQRQFQPALELLDHNLSLPSGLRNAYERLPTHQRRAWVLDLLGRRDEALRDRYAMLAVARETADPAAVAYAMGMLGGAHADQYNLEEADRLCSEATALARGSNAFHAFALAALNHLNALVTLGRGAQALPVVKSLEASEAELSPRAREQRCIVYADVYLQTGDIAAAQTLLDESVRLRHPGSQSLLSWTTTQVACCVAKGQHAQARRLGEAWLANPQTGTDPGEVPSEQLRLLQNLSIACERQGDMGAALRHQRKAFDVHEALVGRSARARRLGLEVEHQLARERWAREQAQQRQQAAEAEGLRLDQVNRALVAANQAKTRFLAAASHDLRQPVQALAMTMAALQCETLSPAQGELVHRMGQSLAALVRMFDVLLDVSRLDAGIVPVRLRALDLRPLLHRLVDEHQAAAQAQGLLVRLRLPHPDLGPLHTRTDPVLLERCLRNLMDNALKYTRRGGVLLAVRRCTLAPTPSALGAVHADHSQAHPADPAGATGWRLCVIDSGIGMSPEVQAQVFDEFFQADNPQRDRSRGLGLGLSIVQRVARLLDHPVGLRSRQAHGTQFSLTLTQMTHAQWAQAGAERFGSSGFSPLHGAPASEVDTEGAALTAAHGGESPSVPGCVAVIDDDASVRDSLADVLERWGHTVVAGSDALGVLASWRAAGRPPVQAVLADLRLRGQLTGLQVVAQLRQRWGDAVPALVITGDMAPERLQLLSDSGLPWLPKPVMPMRLRSWLAAL